MIRLDRCLHQLEEAVQHRALDEDPRARAAVLAGVAEDGAGRARCRGLEVGVGEDHVRRLTAELERHALDRLRGARGDPAADLGRPSEGDLGDVRVGDEPLATLATGPGDDVEHALREAALDGEPFELERAQRGQLGRLEDDRVARGERRPELPGGDRQREVPGHDQPDDAERLPEGHVDPAGDRDRVAEQALRRCGVVAEGVGDHADLAAGVADRLAGVAGLERRQLLLAIGNRIGEPVQQLGATLRRDRAPRSECGPRSFDRSVGLRRAGARDLRHDLCGRRLDHLDHETTSSFSLSTRGRGDEAGDERAALVLLGVPEDAEHVLALAHLDRLDHVVIDRPAGHLEAVAEPANALMVVRAHLQALPPLGARNP